VVLVAELEVKVADVQPTQGFVCLDTFDTPKGKRNVFDVMLEMTQERKPPEWPPMRIARQPRTDTKEGGTLYCIDNRRLFMHKVLCVDSARATACATEVAWMTEFDCKLNQAPPKESDRDRHWRTNDEGIAAAREELNRRLDMAQALHDVSPQALHDVSAGAQMRALVPKKDDELSQYREEMRSLLTRVNRLVESADLNRVAPTPHDEHLQSLLQEKHSLSEDTTRAHKREIKDLFLRELEVVREQDDDDWETEDEWKCRRLESVSCTLSCTSTRDPVKEWTYTKEQLLALSPRTSGQSVVRRFDGHGHPNTVYSSESVPLYDDILTNVETSVASSAGTGGKTKDVPKPVEPEPRLTPAEVKISDSHVPGDTGQSGEAAPPSTPSRPPRVPKPRPKLEPGQRFEYKINFILKFKDLCRDAEHGELDIDSVQYLGLFDRDPCKFTLLPPLLFDSFVRSNVNLHVLFYHIAEILDHKGPSGPNCCCLVRWKDFDATYDSWMLRRSVTLEVVIAYEKVLTDMAASGKDIDEKKLASFVGADQKISAIDAHTRQEARSSVRTPAVSTQMKCELHNKNRSTANLTQELNPLTQGVRWVCRQGMECAMGQVGNGMHGGCGGTRTKRIPAAINQLKPNLRCRMYRNKYPDVKETVVVLVKRIDVRGVYVNLIEYDDKEGMILSSELSRHRISSVKNLVSPLSFPPHFSSPAPCEVLSLPCLTCRIRQSTKPHPFTSSSHARSFINSSHLFWSF
jgi:hypothetical protein